MNWDRLRPWQKENALHLLRLLTAGQNALDASDTGTGKTFSALAVVDALRRPTLALVPKISITSWNRWAEYLGAELDVSNVELVRTGRTRYGQWEHNPPPGMERETFFKCQACQCVVDMDDFTPCYCHHLGIHCLEAKKRPWRYGAWHWNPAIKFLVVDEVHRFGAQKGLNASMLIAARRQGIPVLAMSATPATSPLDFRALGYVLGLHDGDGFYKWTRQFGCRPDPRYRGWVWKVNDAERMQAMSALNRMLFPSRGVRTRTQDIPGFPMCLISAETYDVIAPERINRLYAAMAEPIRALTKRKALDLCPEHPLTKILRAREEVELLKVPVAIELAQDYLAQGRSVAVFVNFASALHELRSRLRTDCFIDGSQTSAQRQACIDSFQADQARVIIVNNQAGGVSVSLHDVRGEHPRVGLVMPSFSARDMRQVFGRLPREGGKSTAVYRVIFAARTVETQIHAALSRKLDNLDALTDADLQPENLTLAKD